MLNIKKGDKVARKSYGKDIIFIVDMVIKNSIAILTGITTRLKADAPVDDLEKISSKDVEEILSNINEKIDKRTSKYRIEKTSFFKRSESIIYTGKILHLDGDKKYSEKSLKYYQSLGLNAIVKNIPENKQPYVVYNLLEYYKPDILVITGHDRNDKKWKGI